MTKCPYCSDDSPAYNADKLVDHILFWHASSDIGKAFKARMRALLISSVAQQLAHNLDWK